MISKPFFCRNCGEVTPHERVTAGHPAIPRTGMFSRQAAQHRAHKYVCEFCRCELSNAILARYGIGPDSELDR